MLPDIIMSRIVSKIKEVSFPVRIILFGSHAYGTPRPDSDIDLVVIENKISSKIMETNKITAALKDIPFPKDIIVASQAEYDFYSKEAGSIFRTVSEKGRVIYG